jgi:predicted extracellular nuclease
MTLSTNGQFLTMTGYDAAVGTAGITGSSSATINRIVGRVDASGAIDTTTALTDAATGSNPRSAVSTNGTDLWMDGGAGGVRYTTLGATTSTQLSTTVTNLRHLNIFNGQLYTTSASGAFRLATVGTGTPTTSGQVITNLPGFPTSGGSPYGFFFADLDAGVAGVDTVYVADDGAAVGIQKYSLVGGNWTARGSISIAGARGLTGVVQGTNVTLYTTTNTQLVTLTDTTGYNVNIAGSPTVLATASANTNFRGVAFAPAGATPTPSPTPALSINDVTQVETNAGTTTFSFTVSLSSPALPSGVSFDIATSDGTAQDGNPLGEDNDYVQKSELGRTITAGNTSASFTVTVNGDTTPEANETFFVNVSNVTGATVSDGQGLGTITNDDLGLFFIHDIQGSAETPNFVGNAVQVRGIVVGDFQGGNNLSGFFVQEEDADADANPATSEGIFVFDGASPATNVNIGDDVTVTGSVANTNGLTQLTSVTSVLVNSTGNPAPSVSFLFLPVATSPAVDFERVEGMRVLFSDQLLYVTDVDDLGRFGEVTVSSSSPLYIPTNSVDPNDNPASGTNTVTDAMNTNVAAVTAQQNLNNRNRLIIDDGTSKTNTSVTNPLNPIPFLIGSGTNATLRRGDFLTNTPAIMSFGFGNYRLEPIATFTFNQANPRPLPPPLIPGSNVRACGT